MDLVEKINRTAFLGAEFLTFLWFKSETSETHYRIDAESEPFEVFFDDRLTVGGAQVNAQENLFRGGHPTSSLEAHAALRLGKLAMEARVRLVRGAQEWAFVLKASELAVSALQVPAVLSKNDEDRFYERMYLVEELEKMLNYLYREFLMLKISSKWQDEVLPTIQSWVWQTQVSTTQLNPKQTVGPKNGAAFDIDDEALGERPPWETTPSDDQES